MVRIGLLKELFFHVGREMGRYVEWYEVQPIAFIVT